MGQEAQQPGDRRVADHEGDHHRNQQLPPGRAHPLGDRMEGIRKREQSGGEHRRNGKQETESRRQRTIETEEQPGADRRSGPGHPGDQRQTLRQSDQQAVAPGELIGVTVLLAEVLGGGDHRGEHQHRGGDHPQVAHVGTDHALERHSQHDDRNGADDDVPAHPVVGVVTVRFDQKPVEPGPKDPDDVAGEVDQHGGLGAQLRHRGERCAGVLAEEDPRHDRQMTR